MNCVVKIMVDGVYHCYPLHLSRGFQRIDCDGVVIFDIWKIHDHRYELRGFFYAQKIIIADCTYHTKKELYGAIQNFLQQYL